MSRQNRLGLLARVGVVPVSVALLFACGSTDTGGGSGGSGGLGSGATTSGASGAPVVGNKAGGTTGASQNSVTGGTGAVTAQPGLGGGGASTTGGSSSSSSGGTGAKSSSGGRSAAGGASAVAGSGGKGGSSGALPVATDGPALVAAMGLGWNLGNSLDSVGGETAWGNPKVTPALIQTVADAGFGVVRIPVTWAGQFGDAPGYTINEAYLSRVEEVVGYVLERKMYAIINIHHDGADDGKVQWLSLKSGGQGMAQFTAIWKQLATRFKEKSDHLIFEAFNELHVGYDAPLPEYYKFITSLDQTFVDTVRATGGNNTGRWLVVPGYNTNIDYTVAGWVKPTDPTANRLVMSCHFYDPWDYAGAGKTHAWGAASPGHDTWGQEDSVTTQFDKLKTNYGDKGIPVILGEYGAVQQDGYDQYRRYYMEYVTKAAHDRGIVPIYWDNGGPGTGADAFGLFSRTDGTPLHPEVQKAMFRAMTSTYTLAQVAKP